MSKISSLCKSDNIAENLEETEKSEIVHELLKKIQKDEESMSDWLKYAEQAIELTELHREEKHMPWRNSANIKYPLISTAIIQYAARAQEDTSQNGKICKSKVIGEDPTLRKQRLGERICTHLNWQIQEKIPNFYNNVDKRHHQLALVGTLFTKTYFDPVEGIIQSDLIPYDQIIINMGTQSLEKADRVTHIVYMSTREIVEQQRWGYFCDEFDPTEAVKDKNDPDAVDHELYECHCWLNLLDEDEKYYQPYIVTIHKATNTLLRIVTRFDEKDVIYNKSGDIKKIYPKQYFTDYHFIPSDKFFSWGFGTLLLDSNATVNSLLNQILNAGSASTMQGGFIDKNLRVKKEEMELDPCSWIQVEGSTGAPIKDSIVPFMYKEPSQVLLSLVTFLIKGANDLTSITEVLTGQADTQNSSPNTVNALKEQGLVIYNSIIKRENRSFKKELEKIVALNSQYVNEKEYIELITPSPQELKEIYNSYGQFMDYQLEGIDIVPVVDINEATSTENKTKAMQGITMAVQFAQVFPGRMNPDNIIRTCFNAIEWPNIDQLILPPPPPQPNPEMVKLQLQAKQQQEEAVQGRTKLQIEGIKAQSQSEEKHAKALKMVSDIHTDKSKLKVEQAKHQLNAAIGVADVSLRAKELNQDMMQHNNEMHMQGQQMQQDAKANQVSGPDQTLSTGDDGQGQPEPQSQRLPDETLMHLPSHHAVYREAARRGWVKKSRK